MTHATPPIALGSFLPFTGLPITNDGNLVLEGKYFDFSDAGSVSSKVFDACVEVMEHQGASDITTLFNTLHNRNVIKI